MAYSSTTSVVVHASHEKVWQAITDPKIVKRYFFGTLLETDWKPGSPLFFRGEWEGKQYEDKGTVLGFEPMRALSYDYWSSFSGQPDTPELRQVIRYELVTRPDGVQLIVNQSNVDTQERAEHSAKNWRVILDSMKTLLEAEQS